MSPHQDQPQFESWGRYPKHAAEVRPLFWREDFPRPLPPKPKHWPWAWDAVTVTCACCSMAPCCDTQPRSPDLVRFPSRPPALRSRGDAGGNPRLRCAARLVPAREPRHQIRNRRWSHCRHSRQEPPRRGHLRPAHAVLRAGALRRHTSGVQRGRYPKWYSATIGGMGLTGLISWAEVQMRPIVSAISGIDPPNSSGWRSCRPLESEFTYRVLRGLDRLRCPGRNFARGIFMLGEHDENPGPLTPCPGKGCAAL